MTEYQIRNTLQEITMMGTAYKATTNYFDLQFFQAIIAGFTGQRKNWWDQSH